MAWRLLLWRGCWGLGIACDYSLEVPRPECLAPAGTNWALTPCTAATVGSTMLNSSLWPWPASASRSHLLPAPPPPPQAFVWPRRAPGKPQSLAPQSSPTLSFPGGPSEPLPCAAPRESIPMLIQLTLTPSPTLLHEDWRPLHGSGPGHHDFSVARSAIPQAPSLPGQLGVPRSWVKPLITGKNSVAFSQPCTLLLTCLTPGPSLLGLGVLRLTPPSFQPPLVPCGLGAWPGLGHTWQCVVFTLARE